ncbi:MAG: hypothetical protein IPO92_13410 [Saprospiraceae bacterium]|nr:hypothetical protein [Saprospiraceae bacterium]
MKQLIFVPIILVITYLVQLFGPWWLLTIVCFVVCYYFKLNKFMAFTGSLLAIFILWFVKAFLADANFDEAMSGILGALFGGISDTTVLFLTGLTGGLAGGLSGLLGSWSQTLFSKN